MTRTFRSKWLCLFLLPLFVVPALIAAAQRPEEESPRRDRDRPVTELPARELGSPRRIIPPRPPWREEDRRRLTEALRPPMPPRDGERRRVDVRIQNTGPTKVRPDDLRPGDPAENEARRLANEFRRTRSEEEKEEIRERLEELTRETFAERLQ